MIIGEVLFGSDYDESYLKYYRVIYDENGINAIDFDGGW